MKYLGILIITLIIGGFVFAGDSYAAYSTGEGFAQRIADTPGTNQVRFEFYQVTSAASGNNATLTNPYQVDIVLRNVANPSVIAYEFHCGGSNPACNTLMTSTGVKILTGIADGTYTQESYVWQNLSQYNRVSRDTFYDSQNVFSGNNVRYIHRFFARPSGSSAMVNATVPVNARWYYTNGTNQFSTSLLEARYVQQSGGISLPAQTSGTLKQLGINTSVSSLPATTPTAYTFAATPADGFYPTTHALASGYVQYANGTESGRFKELSFGIDNTAPNVTCTLYKKDGTTPLTNGNTGEDSTIANNKVVVAKVTVSDTTSGILDWEIQRSPHNANIWTTVGSVETTAYPSGVNRNVDLPLTLPDDYPYSDYDIRVRARDLAYNPANTAQDHYSYDQCGTDSTPNNTTPLVPIRVQDTDYQLISPLRLYYNDGLGGHGPEITSGASVASGVDLIASVTVKDNSLGKLSKSFNVGLYENSISTPQANVAPLPDQTFSFNTEPICLSNSVNTGCNIYTQYDENTSGGSLSNEFTVEFLFTSSSVPFDKKVWVFVDSNDSTTEKTEGAGDNLLSINYFIGENQWFKTTGGDVGAVDNISISQETSSEPQGSFMLVRGSTGINGIESDSGWKLAGYESKLVPQAGGAGSSLWNYFFPKLSDSIGGLPNANRGFNAPGACATEPRDLGLPYGVQIVSAATTWNHLQQGKSLVLRCYPSGVNGLSNMTFSGYQPPGKHIFIIDGDMTIDGDFVCCAVGDGAQNGAASQYWDYYDCDSNPAEPCKNTYIVNGDLTINTNVEEVRGVFIVGGNFKDYTNVSNNVADNKLTVEGAIYAESMDLGRELVGTPTVPALEVIFSPDQYFLYNSVCGETDTHLLVPPLTCYHMNGKQVGWKEVAP